jgi:hypothetical protein
MENRIVLAGIMVTAVTMLVMIGMATATINSQMAYARHWSHGWGAGGALIGGLAGHAFCGPLCGAVGSYLGDKAQDALNNQNNGGGGEGEDNSGGSGGYDDGGG